MLAESASNQRPPLGGQFDLAHPAIPGLVVARNERFFDQPINGDADRTRSEPDFWADCIDRKRPLVEQRFEDAEIGVAQICPLDALGRVRGQGLKGLHEDEPDMNPGEVLLLACSLPCHCAIHLDINYIDVNILGIKQINLP